MNKEDKRGIFFGVVGVLTLIVAIIGASLAYFSINARSDDDVVTVQAASVQIVYESGKKLNVSDIIPASQEVAVATFERYLNGDVYTDASTNTQVPFQKCVDDNKRNVCGAYNFKIKNEGTSTATITMTVEPTAITTGDGSTPKMFKNLSYILYDVTGFTENESLGEYVGEITDDRIIAEGTFNSNYTTDDEGNVTAVTSYEDTIIVDYDGVNTENNLTVGAKATKIYRLFVWLDETGVSQDYEQGAAFQGAISIEVAGAADQITGNADKTLNP